MPCFLLIAPISLSSGICPQGTKTPPPAKEKPRTSNVGIALDNHLCERLEVDKIVCVTFVEESSGNWNVSVGLRLCFDDVGIGAGTVAVKCP